jgi:hypothetical protein
MDSHVYLLHTLLHQNLLLLLLSIGVTDEIAIDSQNNHPVDGQLVSDYSRVAHRNDAS